MFSIGDLVVHPMHGAGVIDDIVQERINGVTQDYYVFKMPVGGLMLKIPTANSCAIGLRSIVDAGEAEAVLRAIPAMEVTEDLNCAMEVTEDLNWNKRYRENMLRLKSGDLYEVARVIKALMRRDAVRGLSTGERKMLRSAKQILLSELTLSARREYRELEDRLNRAMAQTGG